MDEKRSASPFGEVPPQGNYAAFRARSELYLLLSRLGVALLAMRLTQQLCQLLVLIFFPRRGLLLSPSGVILVEILCYACSMLVPLAILLKTSRHPARVLLPMRRVPAGQLLPSLFICLGISTFANLFSNLFSLFLEDELGLTFEVYEPVFPTGFWPVLLTFISVAVLPAFLEELLFRGVMLQSLRPFGDRFAIVMSAVLFMVCHTTVRQLLPALIVGLALSYFAIRTGSLWTGVCVHLVYNGCSALLTLLSARFGLGVQGFASLLLLLTYLGGMAAGLASLFFQFGPHALRLLPDPKTVPTREKLRMMITNPGLVLGVVAFLLTTLSTIRIGGRL